MTEQVRNEAEAYEEVYADVPGWPRVVGLFSIVWGSLGIVCGGCGTLFLALSGNLMKMAEEQNGPTPEVLIAPVAAVVTMGVGTVVTVLLLMAGIMTLKRSMTGRTLHLVYAPLSIANSVAGMVVSMQHQKAIAEWAAANPDNLYAKSGWYGGSGGSGDVQMIMAVAMTAIAVAYPLFCLIWFGLVKKTQASMTGVPDELSGT